MKKSVFILVFTMVQTLVFAQKNFLDQPYIETSAKVDTLITPDKIYLSITISEADSKNKKTVETQEKEMEKALKSLNINTEKDLVLLDLASNFRNYLFKGQNILKSKRYELLVSDAMMAGKVLIALEDLGISNAKINRTEYSKEEQLLLELKSKAVAKTKIVAEKLAKPLGQKVGKAVHISDNFTPQYKEAYLNEIVMVGYGRKSRNNDEEPINIEVKKIKFETTVSIKYILE